ncbi:MAG: xanthine dehydrogenase family protein subunit M [Acidobacteria bacterium]|nr:xanthine dehydrogenase family protein subunit M [Acidobacteriota bacterium]
MFPPNFDYVCPATLSEAVRLLSEHGEAAKILAGGQSLIPLLKLRLASPKLVVDIGRLRELQEIRESNGNLDIGSLVRHAEIERSELLAQFCPLLPETAAEIGDIQVRNRGTIGGSLAHADPAGDFSAAILALGAILIATSAEGERTIPAQDFFRDLMTTALRPQEILTTIRVPKIRPQTGSAYLKMHQPASGFAIVGVATTITLDPSGKVEEVRVGITGLAPAPFRANRIEAMLLGSAPGAREIREASRLAAEVAEPLSDIHASADYRRELAAIFTRRSLEKASERARQRL